MASNPSTEPIKQPERRRCLVEGCELPNHSRGLCGTHMEKKPPKKRGRKPCLFEGCDGVNFGHGLCHAHYMQRRRGVELRAIRPPKPTAGEGLAWCGTCEQFRDVDEFGWDTTRDQLKRRCRPCINAAQKKWASENQERINLERRLKKRGLTEDEFAAMFDAQSGLCGICRRPRALDIDHDHDTGEVRGLLCGPCNRGIGFLDDDMDLMRSAIEYLEP